MRLGGVCVFNQILAEGKKGFLEAKSYLGNREEGEGRERVRAERETVSSYLI